MQPGDGTRPEDDQVTPEGFTQAKLEFFRAAGVPMSTFSAAAEREVQEALARSRAAAHATVSRWMSMSDVAELLGVSCTAVRRMVDRGQLSAARAVSTAVRFPAWQFGLDGKPLAGLSDVLAAAPPDFDPILLASFMDEPEEQLAGLSPREWIIRRRDAGAVVRVLDDLSWT